jgi:hypothetical protein
MEEASRMMRIKCIGFSVTGYGDPSYSIVLKSKLEELGLTAEVSYASVGGLSIDALPFLLPSMVNNESFDLVVLEVATSWFSLVRKNQSEADAYLDMIVNYLRSINTSIVFLNLYRKDIADDDLVVNAINKYGENYPILDLKSKYRARLTNDQNDGTTDGVHPTQSTIDEIATDLAKFISSEYSSESFAHSNSIVTHENRIFLPPVSVGENFTFDNRHGLVINGLKFSGVNSLELSFGTDLFVTGLFFVYGPDTSSLDLVLDDEKINIPMYDEMSFYRRLGYRYIGGRTINNFKIDFSYECPSVKLKREPWEKFSSRSCYLLGFTAV